MTSLRFHYTHTILTNERFDSKVTSGSDVFATGGEVSTDRGRNIPYDLPIWCVGGKPNTG